LDFFAVRTLYPATGFGFYFFATIFTYVYAFTVSKNRNSASVRPALYSVRHTAVRAETNTRYPWLVEPDRSARRLRYCLPSKMIANSNKIENQILDLDFISLVDAFLQRGGKGLRAN